MEDELVDCADKSLESEDELEEVPLAELLEVSEPAEALSDELVVEPEVEAESLLEALSDELEEPLDVSEPEEDDELDSCELELCVC